MGGVVAIILIAGPAILLYRQSSKHVRDDHGSATSYTFNNPSPMPFQGSPEPVPQNTSWKGQSPAASSFDSTRQLVNGSVAPSAQHPVMSEAPPSSYDQEHFVFMPARHVVQ